MRCANRGCIHNLGQDVYFEISSRRVSWRELVISKLSECYRTLCYRFLRRRYVTILPSVAALDLYTRKSLLVGY